MSRERSASRTKIVCTIGPVSRSPETLRRLILAGMNVARLNFSHGSLPEHGENIRLIREASEELDRPVAVLQDLAGVKIRIGEIENGPIVLESGDRFVLTSRAVAGSSREVSLNYPDLPNEVEAGDPLLLSDGALELQVEEVSGEDIVCTVVVGGPLSSFKGINLPTRSVRASGLTEKDRGDLAFGIEQEVDYVALSFVKSADDVVVARRFMAERGSAIPVIAKIEKHEALKNIDEIIESVDGIMVARGDLGVEIPFQKVPLLQKMLISRSNQAGKPVITATQMLRSMVDNPRPTRAEVTDVANAVLDGTDALMLSEETAIGKYPVETVRTMVQIALDAESGFPFEFWTQRFQQRPQKVVPEAVSSSACRLAEQIHAAVIITCTQSGSTARMVSKFRPRSPILAVTPERRTFRRLSLNWGVTAALIDDIRDTDQMIAHALEMAEESGFAKTGDKVVITAGGPVGVPGTTNLIKAEEIE